MKDKLVRASHVTRDALDTTSHDLANRTRGIVAATRARWHDVDVSDEVLLERVRAKLGRVSSHPRAIDVAVDNGHVTMRGSALADEARTIISKIERVRGVRSVTNELDLHATAENIPSLQGEGRVAGSSLDFLQPTWAPATRALVAAAGLAATGLMMSSYARRSTHPALGSARGRTTHEALGSEARSSSHPALR